jgi:2-hydroxycyclohexanecarboxyl-CoA dehydrogenase
MEFAGKTALVTGAARGIGMAVCQALAASGCRVVVVDINGEGAEQVARDIVAAGGEAMAARCDVSSDQQVADLKGIVEMQFGSVDILINNAVAHQLAPGTVDDIDIGRWKQALDINVLGCVRMVDAFVPAMLARGHGYLVTTSSSLAILPNKATQHMLPYVTSKGAQLGMAYGLAYALRPRGVLASVFCPGLTSTRDDGASRLTAMGFLDGLSETQAQPGTMQHAAAVLLDGMRRELFLISSHPDYAAALARFANNGLDPLSVFEA